MKKSILASLLFACLLSLSCGNSSDTAPDEETPDLSNLKANTLVIDGTEAALSVFSYGVSNAVPSLMIPSITTVQVFSADRQTFIRFSFSELPQATATLRPAASTNPQDGQYFLAEVRHLTNSEYFPKSDDGLNVTLEKDLSVTVEDGIITFALFEEELNDSRLNSQATGTAKVSVKFSFELAELDRLDQTNVGNLSN